MRSHHGRHRRRAWYFTQQRGRCCLQSTYGCAARGGLMRLDVNHEDASFATFEHLQPRCTIGMHECVKRGRVILLACRQCNLKKGARTADASMIAIAALYFEQWIAFAHDTQPNQSRIKRRAVRHHPEAERAA